MRIIGGVVECYRWCSWNCHILVKEGEKTNEYTKRYVEQVMDVRDVELGVVLDVELTMSRVREVKQTMRIKLTESNYEKCNMESETHQQY